MPRRTICLVTPLHLSINPRLVKEADALAEAGHDVKVICGNYMASARKVDRHYHDRPWQIVAQPSFGPEADTLSRVLELARRSVASIAARALDVGTSPLAMAAHHPIAPLLVRAALKVRADLYIAHREIALPAAAIASRRYGAKYSFDAEDYHQGEHPDGPQFEARRQRIDAFERPYIGACAYLSAAAPGIAEAYSATYGIARPEVILNVFPLSHAPAKEAETAGGVGGSVYWYSQTIGPERGVECAVRAIGRAKSKPNLYLRGAVASGFVETLFRIAKEEGASGRLHILPLAEPWELERLASVHDIGLSCEPCKTRNNAILLSNKIYSYLLAGLPIAMAASEGNIGFAREIGAAGKLFPVEDADALARVIDEWLLDAGALREARRSAWQLGQTRYNWEAEKPKFVALVEKALA